MKFSDLTSNMHLVYNKVTNVYAVNFYFADNTSQLTNPVNDQVYLVEDVQKHPMSDNTMKVLQIKLIDSDSKRLLFLVDADELVSSAFKAYK